MLRHADAVAGVGAAGGVQDRFALHELVAHIRVAFEAAGRQNDAAPGANVVLAAVGADADTAYLATLRLGEKPQRRRAEPDLDAVLDEIVVQDLEQFGSIRRAVRPRIVLADVKARHLLDGGVIERVSAWQRIVARVASLRPLFVDVRRVAAIGRWRLIL